MGWDTRYSWARLAQAGPQGEKGGPLLLTQLRDEGTHRARVRGAGIIPDFGAPGGEPDRSDPLVGWMLELLHQSGFHHVLDQTGHVGICAPEPVGKLGEADHLVVAQAAEHAELGRRDLERSKGLPHPIAYHLEGGNDALVDMQGLVHAADRREDRARCGLQMPCRPNGPSPTGRRRRARASLNREAAGTPKIDRSSGSRE